jgi:serine/threonine protein kinase
MAAIDDGNKQPGSDGPAARVTTVVQEGQSFKGRYMVERELGRGGVGVIYLARDTELPSRKVVVKVLLEKSVQDAWIRTKFRHEIEALSRIDHPGVVGLLDFGETEEGLPFLVMQYVEGRSLRSLLQPEGMDLARVCSLLEQIVDALAAAHEKGVLHRDLKPENIMVRPMSGGGDQVKLIDFGLAKVKDSLIAQSTVMPNVAGTFGYMSPEQLLARPATATSDVYSLGIIAYEMVTGRRPFQPQSAFELLEMQRAGPRVPAGDLRPGLPPETAAALQKALSFQPSDRYPTVREFSAAFSRPLQNGASTLPETVLSTVRAVAPRQGLFPFLLSVSTGLLALLFILKESFYRFSSWGTLAARPGGPAWLVLAVSVVLLVIRSGRGMRRAAVVAGPVLAVLALLMFLRLPPPVGITRVERPAQALRGYTLNYSDHRGYKYTIADSSFSVVRIAPGLWNTLSDYKIRLQLSSELEFADVYLDPAFAVSEQLALLPSNTNDILVIDKSGDSFRSARSIAFTCKYRTPPRTSKIRVVLSVGESNWSYEEELSF